MNVDLKEREIQREFKGCLRRERLRSFGEADRLRRDSECLLRCLGEVERRPEKDDETIYLKLTRMLR
jgi:hypothetical protein